MKVYQGSNQNKWDIKKVPQIKIKNEALRKSGFEIGKEFTITYFRKKIILEVQEPNTILTKTTNN